MVIPVGIVGYGTYFPERVEKAAHLVADSGIPEDILIEKMGIRQRHVAAPDELPTEMAAKAARKALVMAGLEPEQLNLVVYHGSEHKDHLVWVAAGRIQYLVGAVNAFAVDVSAVCAGGPIAMTMVRGMMQLDEGIQYALLVVGTRERQLINLRNTRSRFMFNFADGAAAVILKRDEIHNQVLGSAAITDGSLAETVYLTPEAAEGDGPMIRGDLQGRLDVTHGEFMAERLSETTLDNFVAVIQRAVEKSGYTLDDVNFLGITHMKRSFYLQILDAIGLTPDQSIYLENFGHVQSADQIIALEQGILREKIKPGDLLVFAGAGAGYTWSAIAVKWG